MIKITGSILEKTRSNDEIPLVNAKVSYSKKIFIFTDKEGKFSFEVPADAKQVWIQHDHVSFDTIALSDVSKELRIVYPIYQKIKDVVITQKRFSTEISLLTPQKVERIGSKELLKAACCNLSESFETTPSVDVAFTDAITGYRQIQLLGLAGPYTLITRENIPEVRGLASITGLSFTPGQWIEGMQLSKGTGSVVNGFEGLAGQINIELRKPMEGDKQYYNIYQSNQGRSEANAYLAFEPRKGMFTNVFLHGKSQWMKVDQNKDHYIDQPLGNSFIASNRWMWFGKKGRELQAGVKYVESQNWGGSYHFTKDETPSSAGNWGMKLNTRRVDAWSKIGKVFEAKPWKSMGLQLAYSHHDQDFDFARKNFDARENTLYANYIFQTIIGHTGRVLKAGATMNYMEREEDVMSNSYANKEFIPGVYTEYAHTFSDKWNFLAGLRLDHHNKFGLYVTPRVHIRYAPVEALAFRASAGKAYRSASVFSENLGYFSTNRNLQVFTSDSNGIYGLQNEEAWNTGINATYKFKLNYRSGTLSADYYYTSFQNQVLADWENERYLYLYNSSAPSFAHSFQVQLDYELIRKFDIRLAYRFHDVRATYSNGLQQKPFNARHRAFLNLAYSTRNKWAFDYTLLWTGSKRIPSTASNPVALQMPTKSPSYFLMNIHVNKALGKRFEANAGVENLLNYMQMQPILDSENPFGKYFDASMVWGPSMGRNIYAGLRYKM